MKRFALAVAVLLLTAAPVLAVRQQATLTVAVADSITLTATTNGPNPQIAGTCSLDGALVWSYPGFGVGRLTVEVPIPADVDSCRFHVLTTRDGWHFRVLATVEVAL